MNPLQMTFKPPPKRCSIATLDPEAYGILQRNLTTLMSAQVPPESFNPSHLFVHEIGEPMLRCGVPFGVRAYACLAYHDLIFSGAFGNFIIIDLQLYLSATEVPSLLQAASL
jgi:hypothetical protein